MTWLDTWKNRIKITVDGEKISESSLTDFPVLITLASGVGINNADVTDVFDELSVVVSGSIDSYTKLLLHTEADASSYPKTAVIYGNPKLYSNFGKFDGSFYTDGTGDYLSIADHDDWNFAAGDFTVDFWVYPVALSSTKTLISHNVSASHGWAIDFVDSDQFAFYYSTDGSDANNKYFDHAFSTNTWYHIAVARSGSSLYGFIDGVLVDTVDVSGITIYDSTGSLCIGGFSTDYRSQDINAYFSEVRVSKGIARWTSSFTAPTSPYTTESGIDAYTKLMYHFGGDKGITEHTLTFNGDSDFESTINKFSDGNNGYGSYRFDGVGDYVSIADHDDWNFGNGTFTIDFWVRFFALPAAGNANAAAICGQWNDFGNGWQFILGNNDYGAIGWQLGINSGGSTAFSFMQGVLNTVVDRWYHVALIRGWGGSANLFAITVDGAVVASAVSTLTIPNFSSYPFTIGATYIGGVYRPANCYISEFRVSKGTARWTQEFVPPALPYPGYNDLVAYPKRIAIASSTVSGTVQHHVEIEKWNPYIKEAVLWTSVPSLTYGVDFDLYLYYDITQPNNTVYVGYPGEVSSQGVWADNYKGVWHLSQIPTGVAGEMKDSTSMAGHGSRIGANLLSLDGPIDGAIDFTGSYIDCGTAAGDALGNDRTSVSISWWFKSDVAAPNSGLVGLDNLANSGSGYRFLAHLNAGNIYIDMDAGAFYQSYGFNDTTAWHYVVITYNGSYADLYLDGTRVIHSAYTSGIDFASIKMCIGVYYSSSYAFNGKIDEVQVLATDVGSGWIATNLYNHTDDFLIFGSVEHGPPAYAFTGHVYEYAIPVARTIRVYDRSTGQLMNSTVSSASDGYYYLTTTISGPHYIVCLDDDAGVSFNDLIIGGAIPEAA